MNRPGDRVLEIGPGAWAIRSYIRDTNDLGLEPHRDAGQPREGVIVMCIARKGH